MKDLLRSAAWLLTCKRVDEERLPIRRITLSREGISYFNLSTNSILSFSHEGRLWYFRECPVLQRRRAYFKGAVDSFFDTLDRQDISPAHFRQALPLRIAFSPEEIRSFRQYLEERGEKTAFWRTLSRADLLSRRLGFSIWQKQDRGRLFFDSFGLPGLEEGLYELATLFLWTMRGAASRYRTMKIARGRTHSCFSAVRSVATRIVAEELGLADLVTEACWCSLSVEGKPLLGILSNGAPGSRMVDSQPQPEGSLQKALLDVNALDILCYQTDHGPNNYNLCPGGGVCAFDNDNPSTFFPDPRIGKAFAGCAPFVSADGTVARPFFDAGTAQKLAELDEKRLNARLKPYLNSLQRWALVKRLHRLNAAIAKTAAQNSQFLRSGDWSRETARLECSGSYGNTYLTQAMQTQ